MENEEFMVQLFVACHTERVSERPQWTRCGTRVVKSSQ